MTPDQLAHARWTATRWTAPGWASRGVSDQEHLMGVTLLAMADYAQELRVKFAGCCTDCDGHGNTSDPETNGKCWTCRGTGHPHDGPCMADTTVFEIRREANGATWSLTVNGKFEVASSNDTLVKERLAELLLKLDQPAKVHATLVDNDSLTARRARLEAGS
ncbi:MAG TPA: hypothetical protein VGH72_33575 [Pseudonocardia sp.]